MLLKNKTTDDLIEVIDIDRLVNPSEDQISGRAQSGQEEQNTEAFAKTELAFPSGEELPRCWKDPDYRNGQ